MMKHKQDGFILSTGKYFYANYCIIGLPPTSIGEKIWITEGFDDEVHKDREYPKPEFTNKELMEIAEYMIVQWSNVKKMAGSRIDAN